MREKVIQYKLFESLTKFKGNTAIEYGGNRLTYTDLGEKSNIVFNGMIRNGIKKETFIGVLINDRIDLITTMIGIFKAGCVFVPFEPDFPANHLEKMIRSIGIKMVICDKDNIRRFSGIEILKNEKVEFLLLEDLLLNGESAWHSQRLPVSYHPEDKVYVYFTSGTTGIPRAILGKNKSLLHFINWQIETFAIDESFRFGQLVNIGFDAFLRDVFTSLCSGGTICVPENVKTIMNPEDLTTWLDQSRITLIHCVPSVFKLLRSDIPADQIFRDLKFIFLSGEKVFSRDLRDWYDNFGDRIQLVNLYGTSETTMAKTYYLVRKIDLHREAMPAGKSIRGARVTVLDKNMNRCDNMVVGEVYIRTPYRTFGYLNEPELNRELFIRNPFTNDSKDLICRTGDLGRLLPDGNIEVIGRLDDQVKVQGVRIQLGEIENRLKKYSSHVHGSSKPGQGVQISNDLSKERVCSRCLLSSSYPGIDFDENGVCSVCREYEAYREFSGNYFTRMEDFYTLVEKAKKNNNSEYDCLLLFSGGKDSTYVLHRLVEMGLKVLAFTFDNGYISETAFKNIKRITSALKVDNITLSLNNMKEIFLESLRTEYSVCPGCFKALNSIATEIAYKKGINLIISGLSRGQIFEMRLHGLYSEGIFDVNEIENKLRVLRKMYHSKNDRIARLIDIEIPEEAFNQIYFVDFFRYDDSSIKGIKRYLELKDREWRLPQDTGFCSTNCIINDTGIFVHLQQKGYHNYAVPLSWDCRLKILDRSNGLKELKFQADTQLIYNILEEVGYFKRQIKEAVVLDKEDKNQGKYLCAYFTADTPIDPVDLRNYLLDELPGYMVPSYFIQLEQIPLSPNGKIDRKALASLQVKSHEKHVMPENKIETQLLEIWSEVLKIEKDEMGTTNNLFDMGVNSLTIMSLISRIHKEFNIRISLGDVFNNPTIKKQAHIIDKAVREKHVAIKPVTPKEYYVLSSAQRRIYVLQQSDKSSTAYNMTRIMVLEGDIDKERLVDTFHQLIRRHESLRTSFELMEDAPVQRVHDKVAFEIEYYLATQGINEGRINAFGGITRKETGGHQTSFIIDQFIRPFNLSQSPLLRVGLIKTDEHRCILMLDIHHIISDGVSQTILVKDFVSLYTGRQLSPLRLQYKDYAEWQQGQVVNGIFKTQEEYWLRQFSGKIPVLNLPIDFIRPPIQSFEGNAVDFELSVEKTKALIGIARGEETTLFMLLTALYGIFLSKLSGQEDIVIGVPTAGRRHEDLRQIVGMFVNTLALRTYPYMGKTFTTFLSEIKERTLAAFENQEYQFEEMVEKVAVERDMSRNPLFDVVFVLQNMFDTPGGTPDQEIKEFNMKSHPYEHRTAKFDLTLTAMESGEKLYFGFEYCSKLFIKETIVRFVQYFKRVVSSVLENPEVKISGIELITREERKQVLFDFNNTEAEYPRNKTMCELFAQQLERNGDRIAVVAGEGHRGGGMVSISYRELDRKANQLSGVLNGKGVKPDIIAAIMMKRSLEMIIGIFGILKAGGAYLPIDPDYPTERIEFMLADSGAHLLVTTSAWAEENEKGRRLGIEKIFMNIGTGNNPSMEERPTTYPLIPLASPTQFNLAYVIYTSGSTGRPKGVMVEQRSVVNILFALQQEYPLEESDAYLLKTSYVFDVSVAELFGWYLEGGGLAILEKGAEKDPHKILDTIETRRVTHINFVPSMFNAFWEILTLQDIKKLSSLKYIFLAGEALLPELANKFRRFDTGIVLENIYGPTEGTVYSSKYSLSQWKGEGNILIGKPMQNIALYILDKDERLQPIGVPGELCIGGAGLARGYLNNPALTAEKFINYQLQAADYKQITDKNGKKELAPEFLIYKTGDLARWLTDGNIEFLGRIDHQVKIRGFRIELGEIENRLLKHEEINAAVVISKEDKNKNKYLCAYIVPTRDLSIQGLREFLSKYLPDYMVPAYFVILEQLPLNPNGKIDLKALPKPGEMNLVPDNEYIAPRNAKEKELVKIWENVLARNNIGINDNFFKIGGDSIRALQVISRMYQAGYMIEMRDLFQESSIAGLIPRIKRIERQPEQSTITGRVPLTPIQEWFFETPINDHHHFNQAVMLYSKEGFEEEIIRAVFGKIQEHHDALRMTYRKDTAAGKILQFNQGLDYPLSIQVFDLRKIENSKEVLEAEANEIQSSIDLEKGPLMKLGLFHLDDGDRLLIVSHHLVIDGISWRTLFEDLDALYRQYQRGESLELPLKTDSFKAWAEALSQYASSETFLKEKYYWQRLNTTEVPPLTTNFTRDNNDVRGIGTLSFKLEESDTELLLTKVNDAFKTEINDILLAALAKGFKKTFGLNRFLVALEGHGREELFSHLDISRTIGWFTCLCPVLLEISVETDLARQIKEIKENLRRVPNKGIGYGILKYLTPEKYKEEIDFQQKPRMIFNYLGQFDADVGDKSFEIAKESVGHVHSTEYQREYAFDISGIVAKNRLFMNISYDRSQYKRETVEKFWNNYMWELKHMIAFCSSREKKEFTPSDFTYKDLSIDDLDRLSSQYQIEDLYRLTPMQEGMLFHTLYDSFSYAYFQQMAYRLHGELNVAAVEKSLNELFKQHDILRTVFVNENLPHPIQVILKDRQAELYYEDLSKMAETKEKETFIEEFKEKDKKRNFDLAKDTLMRVSILRLDKEEFEFIWSFHHILTDGWCLGILNAEFFEIYSALVDNREFQLPPIKPYRTYIQWLENYDEKMAENYWKKYLEGYDEAAAVPKMKTQGEDDDRYRNQQFRSILDTEKTSLLDKIASEYQVTVNTLIQSIWGIILSKYNGRNDVLFGAVVSGRPAEIEGIESMVGLFVNTVPVRIRFKDEMRFDYLIKRVQQEAIESEPYHYFPLVDIQSGSSLKQDLFNHIMAFENYPLGKQIDDAVHSGGKNKSRELEVSRLDVFEQTNYDFNIIILPHDRLMIKLMYNGNVYNPGFIRMIAGHITHVLGQILINEELPINELTLLSQEEKRQVLYEFNDTASAFPYQKTLHELFAIQVEKTPDRAALVGPAYRAGVFEHNRGVILTYRELSEKSDQLAWTLRRRGVKRDTLVGIMADRSLEMIIGILAALKAGGAYLPIDPKYPEKRILYMLSDSNAPILLTKRDILLRFPIIPIQNLNTGHKEFEIVVTPSQKQIKDFDALPIPDRTLVNYEKYHQHLGIAMAKHTVSLQATRGCPFNCAFCHKIWPKIHVARSAENIIKEIRWNYDAGIRRFVLIDDVFNLNKKNCSKLFQGIQKEFPDVQLFCSNGLRGDILTKDLIDLMIEAGTVDINLALESASPRIQKLINKNLNFDKFSENVQYLTQKYPHVLLQMELMIGFPTETEEEALMTLEFLKNMKWVDFPILNILKIYHNTDIYRLAIKHGVSKEAIERSVGLAYHELPETLPFSKKFTKEFQSRYLNEYFLLKERLLHKLPYQLKTFTRDEIVWKYDSYLPTEIKDLSDLLQMADISTEELGEVTFLPEDYLAAPGFGQAVKKYFPGTKKAEDTFRILLIDGSLFFSSQSKNILYDMVEEPLGLMYLLSYLNKRFGSGVNGKIIKSRIDFDSFDELKTIITDFKPDLIGLRTLSYFKDLFHQMIFLIRQWGVDVPIISGGPYATSDYSLMLRDSNIDLAVLGEGEITLGNLVEEMKKNNKKLPPEEALHNIPGLAFVRNNMRERGTREFVLLDGISKELDKYPCKNLENINNANDLAYAIYTSGSTGKPKGVMLEHINLVNLLDFQYKYTNINCSRILQFATLSFDASFHEIFSAFLTGGTLYLIDEETRGNIPELFRTIGENDIKTVFLPISFLSLVFNEDDYMKCIPRCLEHIQTAGEQVVVSDNFREYLRRNNVYFHNHYGPSETHVVTTFTMASHSSIPELPSIGKPVANTGIYILDKSKHPLPMGIPGELYIGGIQVGRGYVSRLELTVEKFIPNPFVPGDKMYQTGDLARWMPDGNIEFLGRIDHQVKIRGFRIEPGEIESQLLNYKGIKEAVVLDREDERKEKYLCAYITCENADNKPSLSKLREYLSQKLPDYMIPAYFITMEKIPLTPSGKVDRKVLPTPKAQSNKGYAPPGNHLEILLVELWQKFFGMERVGIYDNFFELGGDSLKSMRLVNQYKSLLGEPVYIKSTFDAPTIAKLAAYFKEHYPQAVSRLIGEEINRGKSSGGEKIDVRNIKHVEKKEYYTLSSSQKRLYILNQLALNSTNYNMPYLIPLGEKVKVEKFEETFRKLIARHESLRTSFIMVNEEPIQKVHDEATFKVDYSDFSSETVKQGENKKGEEIVKDFIRPFDLSQAPLLRVKLIKSIAGKYLLLFDMHHIITDGTSQSILTREFNAVYSGEDLSSLKLQYKDFSEWQNSRKYREFVKQQEGYWIKLFSHELPVLDLPTDYPRPLVQSFEGDIAKFALHEKEAQELKDIAGESGATLFMILLSIYTILLKKLSGQEEIIVGTPIAARRHIDLEGIVGMFANTLPIRNFLPDGCTFKEYLKETKERTLEVFENQEYQFEDLVEKIGVKRDTSRNPIFTVMLNLMNQQDYTGDVLERDEQEFSDYKHLTSKFDLNLTAVEIGKKIYFGLEYCTKLFKAETISRFINYFKNIIAVLSGNSSLKLSEIEIITGKEKKEIFNTSRGIEDIDHNTNKTIHRWFEEQASKTPDHIAVNGSRYGANYRRNLTYKELNEKSNRLARVLRKKGVQQDTVVGLMVERAIEMLVAVLAVMKAGGAYLPIDVGYPEERKRFMLEDSEVKLLLTNHDTDEVTGLNRSDIEAIHLNDENNYHEDSHNLEYINRDSDLVYVIYTSGSTGKPKGVMLEHRNLVNLLEFQYRYTNINCSRVSQFASISFDASFHEIFSALLSGGTLYLIPKETRTDIPALFKIIAANQINTVFLPMSFLKMIFKEEDYINHVPGCIRHIQTAGEQVVISNNFRNYLKQRQVFLHNHYGPSETHVVTTLTLAPWEDIPELPAIGRPILNTDIYILDKGKHLLPVRVPGELYIGGMQVGRGYLGKDKLTTERFIPSPFAPGKKLYRTGDLARWLPDGNIEFLGRIDFQVKIRGFRIEPGEIEAQLANHRNIHEAVVITRENEAKEKYLCAYIVSPEGIETRPNSGQLREYLLDVLPDYMIPSYFVYIDRVPLTPNGKVDRKELPLPEITPGEEYAAPGNEVETKLVEIWSEILDLKKEFIGIDTNFFQLGGHSLRATVMTAKIHKAFHAKVPLVEIFKTPTIRQLARCINRSRKSRYASIEFVEKREYYPVSSAQKRLYVLQQLDLAGTAYNMPEVIPITEKPDKQKLHETFLKLIKRHESPRTSFHLVEEEPVQRVHEDVEFNIEYHNSTEMPIISNFIRPFDLSRAPLLRVAMIGMKDGMLLLIVDMHHIISDGVSHEILVKDFTALYNGEVLPPLRIQYKDFSQWQNRDKANLESQEVYWNKQFEGEIPVLALPNDFPRPPMQSFEGSIVSFEIESHQVKSLKEIARQEGATLYMVLFGLYNILLCKLSGQEDIVVGTPVAGRRHYDLQQIIGVFVNSLPLRSFPRGEKPVKEFLTEVKQDTLEAFENQEYPYEDLVEQVDVNRDVSRNPLFDTMFSLEIAETNMDMPDKDAHSETVKPNIFENDTSKFDLMMAGTEKETKLNFVIQYCTKIFKKETIERLARYFKRVVTSVLAGVDKRISEIDILSGDERQQLIENFNDTGTLYPGDKTILQLFQEQVERKPDRIAVIAPSSHPETGTLQFTYRQLNQNAHQLAFLLEKKGVQADTVVGIMVERSIEMVIGILAILKAGGAYLPIEPDYPGDRINYMLVDSSASILLSMVDILSGIDGESKINEGIELILLDKIMEYFTTLTQPTGNHQKTLPTQPAHRNRLNLAYVIYTSGSTGKPKGVMINHASVVNVLLALQQVYPLMESDAYLLKTSYVFDVSVTELLGWFLAGGRLAVLEKDAEKDTYKILDTIERIGITHTNFVPSMFNAFSSILNPENAGKLSTLRYIFLAGETLLPQLINQFRQINTSVLLENIYGPTEGTIYSSRYSLSQWNGRNDIPIGKPMQNITLYILDKYDHSQPIGVVGELCIGGAGLARGYLNNPGLTAEKFRLRQPGALFEKTAPGPRQNFLLLEGTRGLAPLLYRTGDLARWLPDGNIQFLGRSDHQVKVRGYRIELGEIEDLLLQHQQVSEAVIIAEEDEHTNRYLCAYVVPVNGGAEDVNATINISQLREYLVHQLPTYMIPSYFFSIDRIPLTAGGKVNRKILKETAARIEGRVEFEAPQNRMEEILAKVWQEVLGVERIGMNDNFFEMGMDSIKAIRLSARLLRYRLKVEVKDIFLHPTISLLTPCIRTVEKIPDQGPAAGEIPLTPIQHWFFQRYPTVNHHFNHAVMLSREKGFEEGLLVKTFTKIINHHDALRIIYKNIETGEKIRQINRGISGDLSPIKKNMFDLLVKHFGSREGIESEIEKEANRIQRGINLETGPLVRLGLFKTPGVDHLLVVIHHLLIDGVSWRILLEDFALGYAQAERGEEIHFQEKTDSFKYWAEKLIEYAESREAIKELPYWTGIENTELKPLPRDFKITSREKKRKNHTNLVMKLTRQDTQDLLKKVNHAYNTQINDILLAALGRALADWNFGEKVLINLEGHGRESIIEDIDISRTVGWYTTFYPVTLDMSHSKDLAYEIKMVKETLRKIPNKGIGYGILKYLTPEEQKRGTRFALTPEISFNYLGEFGQEDKNGDISVSLMSSGDIIDPELENLFPIEINGMATDGILNLSFSYNRFEYKKESMEELVNSFKSNLIKIIRHCVQKEEKELTPSDLAEDEEISIEELDQIKEILNL